MEPKKRRSKWVWIELPSGGRAKVRSDAQPETIDALDELMRKVAEMYAKRPVEAEGNTEGE